MIFSIDSKELQNALDKIQVKGKHLTTNGFSSSSIGSLFWAELENNELKLWNGNATFIVKVALTVTGTKDGSFIADAKEMIPFLKSFEGAINVHVGDNISIGQGVNKVATIPKIVRHDGFDAINRIRTMVSHVRYEPNPETLFAFNKTAFEGAFTLNQAQFQKVIKSCELAKSGIYKLNYENNVVAFSSGTNTSSYDETITPTFTLGEDATLDFSGPLYSFFDKDQLLNFYVRDEYPLLIVADDRLLVKAPTVNGE